MHMALSLKNDQAERLARQVAKATGETITQAIQVALEERWNRLKATRQNPILAAQVQEILRRVDALPTLDTRTDDEILGYNENGIPG
jgi:antitoxin VapB